MKKLIFLALLFIGISCAVFGNESVTVGNTYLSIGKYTIEMGDSVTLGDQRLPLYVISYENSDLEVRVAIKKNETVNSYIVMTDKLAVQYSNNEKYFGIDGPAEYLKENGYSTSMNDLFRIEYFRQRIIDVGKNSDMKNVKLIAVYFPTLVGIN